MRQSSISAIFLATGLLLVSCAESIEQPAQPKLSYLEHRELLTKAATDQLATGVTRSDVENYLSYRMHIATDDIQDISRFDIDQDAYVYIVNIKGGGWYLCSGDYSSVPIIAYNESGSLSFDGKQSRHTQGWLHTIREQIVSNRTSNSATVQANRNKWIRSKRVSLTRSGEEPDTTEVDIIVESETLRDDYYPGLTETSWDLGSPFNEALPKKPNSSSRCIASGADVSIAQLVYYTHYAFGFPNDLYGSADCTQYYNQGPPYNFNFSSPTTTTWDDMPQYLTLSNSNSSNWSYVAALYALVASRCSTVYDQYGGLTARANIPGALSDFLLTGVTNQSYSRNAVTNEIEHDRPVLTTGAYSANMPLDQTFLIDGYQWQIFRETEYVYDMAGNLLSQSVNVYENLLWHYNTGDSYSGADGWHSEGYFCPTNRVIHIGWTQ